MPKVLILKGLPASGKSTYALKLLSADPGKYKRVNKDELRQMLDGGKWSKDNEKFVLGVRDALIAKALSEGQNVIVDDTNLAPKHEERIRQLAAHGDGWDSAKVEVKTFDVDVNECIRRDSRRANAVGAEIIRKMHNQFLKLTPNKPEYNPGLSNAIICDMDGTLALHNGRSPYETEKCGDDLVNQPVADILRTYAGTDDYNSAVYPFRIVIVSGRDDTYIGHTSQWLSRNHVPYDEIWLRKANDRRDDAVVKKEIYEAHIKGKYNVLFVLDDRRRVVDMWRREGLTVLQVNDGDF